MTENTSLLKEFARGLVAPDRELRTLVVRERVPDLELEPGDLVVFETGRTWPEGETWLVVRRWQDGQYQFSFAQRCPEPVEGSASPGEVWGRILFTVREPDT